MKEFDAAEFSLDENSRLVILSGAGVSADSGLKTFRGQGGLWEGHRVEEVATPEAFDDHPELVIRFYNERRRQLAEVEANDAHRAIAKLQKEMKERCFLVTQNVDDLHERGGAEKVCHMHGELLQLKCMAGHKTRISGEQNMDMRCEECGGYLRPDIVWFGEVPYFIDNIQRKVAECTHFIFTGTSSQVYPAAGLKGLAKQAGAKVLNINLEIDEADWMTDYYIQGKASEVWPKCVEEILSLEYSKA
ncbi:MAG: NAD-dependent deacylase [Planctomycetes bacterium]|nr:NAD-dependent deacylase [Planctomycetota bacterium]